MNDRFIYHANDIKIKKSQCDFCKHNVCKSKEICEKYPHKKPTEVVQNEIRCKYLEVE